MGKKLIEMLLKDVEICAWKCRENERRGNGNTFVKRKQKVWANVGKKIEKVREIYGG